MTRGRTATLNLNILPPNCAVSNKYKYVKPFDKTHLEMRRVARADEMTTRG
jgi:hypothetical protein